MGIGELIALVAIGLFLIILPIGLMIYIPPQDELSFGVSIGIIVFGVAVLVTSAQTYQNERKVEINNEQEITEPVNPDANSPNNSFSVSLSADGVTINTNPTNWFRNRSSEAKDFSK